ncbi:unnamed protein product [Phytophthora lilii]|uniref:Unnamed protein product n=1 Tax=Phytophthora lilii TaxID=2077276 RepID=A0A9W6TSC0_9STRA|nr:unnamed protein product [Phytophthora lilii]
MEVFKRAGAWLVLAVSLASGQQSIRAQLVENPHQSESYVPDFSMSSYDDILSGSSNMSIIYNPDPLFGLGCLFGKKMWCKGERVCLDPIGLLECAVDAISPIKLDDIAHNMAKAVKDFANDPISTIIDFAEDTLNDAVHDVVNCYTGLAKKQPSCKQMATFQSCINTGINVLSVAVPAAKSLTAARLTKVNKGLKRIKKVADSTAAQCAAGCPGKVCSPPEGTRTYTAPAGCSCRQLKFQLDSHSGVTPAVCSDSIMTTDGAVKVQFKFTGCYVGVGGPSDGYEGCDAAVASSVFQSGGMFVRCKDQYGEEGKTS